MYFGLLGIVFVFAYGVAVQSLLYPNSVPWTAVEHASASLSIPRQLLNKRVQQCSLYYITNL